MACAVDIIVRVVPSKPCEVQALSFTAAVTRALHAEAACKLYLIFLSAALERR